MFKTLFLPCKGTLSEIRGFDSNDTVSNTGIVIILYVLKVSDLLLPLTFVLNTSVLDVNKHCSC